MLMERAADCGKIERRMLTRERAPIWSEYGAPCYLPFPIPNAEIF